MCNWINYQICHDTVGAVGAKLLHKGSLMHEQPGVLAVHLIAPAAPDRY